MTGAAVRFPTPSLRTAVAAGGAYFGVVFAIGFVLGVVRTVAVAPSAGETLAVALELPLILGAAWIACRRLIRGLGVPATMASRAVMGGVAFALLMLGETAVSISLGGRGLGEHLALYRQAPQLLGLAGQVVFAAFPLLQRRAGRRG